MKIGELKQRCGSCSVIEYCGNPWFYCLCTDSRFRDIEESFFIEIANSVDVKAFEGCHECKRGDCEPYFYSKADFEDEECENYDEMRDYVCKQIADYVFSKIQTEEG